jgi:hypothetical protein
MSQTARVIALIAASTAVGCTPPPEAPSDLEELSTFLFAEFESDEAVLAAGVANLETFLLDFESTGTLAADANRRDRTWSLPILGYESMDMTDRPADDEFNTATQLPVALAIRSAFPGSAHTELITLADQTVVEADSAESYAREVLSGGDCFLDGSCQRLEAHDVIHRVSPPVLDLVYEQNKHYRHIPYGDDGDVAVVSRSWVDQEYTNEDGDFIDQWFGINVNVIDGDETIRYSALWGSSSVRNSFDDDTLVNLIANGIEEAFQNVETFLAQ